MAVNLHEMTLLELKSLARELIGRGISKLRTKETLIEALQKLDANLVENAVAQKTSEAAQKSEGEAKAEPVKKPRGRASKAKVAPSSQGELFKNKASASAVDSMRALLAMCASSPAPAVKEEVVPVAKISRASSKKNAVHSDEAPKRPVKTAKSKKSASAVASEEVAPVAKTVSSPKSLPADDTQTVYRGGILSSLADTTSTEADAPTVRTRCSDPFFLNDAAEPTPDDMSAGLTPVDEDLGDLPDSYDEERLVLVSKGPYALYLYWDLKLATVSRLSKSDGVILCLRLFANQKMVREMECRLDDRSWYFYGLQPGLSYSVQLVTVANDGQCQPLCEPSNTVTLPSDLPSTHIDDKFVSIAIDVDTGDAEVALQTGILPSNQERHTSSIKSDDDPRAPFSLALREALYLASGGKFAHEVGSSEHFPTEFSRVPSDNDDATPVESAHPWSGLLAGLTLDKTTTK